MKSATRKSLKSTTAGVRAARKEPPTQMNGKEHKVTDKTNEAAQAAETTHRVLATSQQVAVPQAEFYDICLNYIAQKIGPAEEGRVRSIQLGFPEPGGAPLIVFTVQDADEAMIKAAREEAEAQAAAAAASGATLQAQPTA